MAYFDTSAPLFVDTAAKRGAQPGWFKRTIRAVQYARMMQALNELNDEHLERIGISRADIPAHAHACVYEFYD